QAIVAALPQHLPRSVSLFGHSYGALLAFEIAQHLLLRDDTVDHVFLSAHGPQFAPRTNPIYPLPQDAFIAAIRSFAGPTADLLLDPMIAELSLPSLIGDLTAAETHAMNKDVHAKLCISALYGTDDPRAMMQDLERWKDFAVRGNTAHFDLQSFEGGHLFLLEKSQEVARYILKQLSAVQTEIDAPNVALID
ncbi:MAG: alpha/beta fold hydrolase, partial [Pseudoruegeria sp.]